MSDTTRILQLPGAQLASIEQDGSTCTLHFSLLQLVQEMEGAFEDSLWTQAIDLVVGEAVLEGALPACPCVIKGGDLSDNIYTYRNHAPLPIRWRGEVVCKLVVDGTDAVFTLRGAGMEARPLDHPRYIRHIKKEWQAT